LPAYQEEVPGTDHLRVMVFGEDVHTARIRSGALDWRLANDMEVEQVAAEPMLAAQLRAVVERLGLRMGVFDLKVRPDGQIVFLEVNPQGQYLFVEGMSDMPLGDAFARFAARELRVVPAGSADPRPRCRSAVRGAGRGSGWERMPVCPTPGPCR
jgi:hypothetical protein